VSETDTRALEDHAFQDIWILLGVDAMEQLKALYCRYLDTKDWDQWRTVFADCCICCVQTA
jgi:hypothetical protein